MFIFKFLLFITCIVMLADASIYEDAEDIRTSRWRLVSARDISSINNVWDLSKKSHVIEFKGKGTQHSYELKTKQLTQHENWLTWDMKFSKDFVIIVVLKTNMGKYNLIYTPGVFRGYMQYGLGDTTANGKWQTIKRNLLDDIAYFDNRVNSVILKSFVVKGNGRIDNIMTKQNILPKKVIEPIPNQQVVKIEKDKKEKRVFKSSLPVIKLKGIRLVKLNLGEEYIEKGVSAYDKEDGKIEIESTNDINPYVPGRYMILYMAKDSDGNMAVDKRYVEVGDVKNDKKEVRKEKIIVESKKIEEEKEEEVYEEEDIKYLEEKEQISMWERELALREKELAKKEKRSKR